MSRTVQGIATALMWTLASCGDAPASASPPRHQPETSEQPQPRREAGGLRVGKPGVRNPTPYEKPSDASLANLSYIAAASGATPEFNQVSIEQDLALAKVVFGPGGHVLFGAGAGTRSVQVLATRKQEDPVRLALADLFSPRGGRDSTYREPTIEADGPATAQTVSHAIAGAVKGDRAPLLVYLAGHGHQGDTARDNGIGFWGSSQIRVAELASLLQPAARQVAVVATTCFSGGFAELAFEGARSTQGAPSTVRCGLFASTWDLEASGCDPNPDRAAQEGYGLHFLQALRRQDARGRALPDDLIDFDGDGAISLLEAHTRVRIASTAADVPTTTSERWLRERAPTGPTSRAFVDIEEQAVIDAWLPKLKLQANPRRALLELQRIEERIEAVRRELGEAQRFEDQAFRAASAELLARWPTLDDPWHPRFTAELDDQRLEIQQHLESSPAFADYSERRQRVDRYANQLVELRRKAAPYERLSRALDSRDLAARLRHQGGEDWEHYLALRACERTIPPHR